VSLATFDFCDTNNIIKISGSEYTSQTFESFLKLITKVTKKYKNNNVKITGNFNSKLLAESFVANKNNLSIDKLLYMLQLISNTMTNSNVTFISEINGIVQGPAMEIALCCNFIKAEHETSLKFDEASNGIIPFLGTIQRLTKLIGYKNSLQALLIDKKITYEKALQFRLFNNEVDNLNIIECRKFFWDQNFTNTFIFFNSKIHSIYKNKQPAYNAILSIIFESSVCDYEASLSIEKRWLKWLINHELFSYAPNV
jgi:hypothetical protein